VRAFAALTAVIVLGTSAVACGTSQATAQHSAITNPKPQPSLDLAIRRAAHLGPAGAETEVNLSLGLKVRQPELLASLLAQGKLPEAKAPLLEYLKLSPTGSHAEEAKALLTVIK